MKIEKVKGFRDFIGEESLKRKEIKKILEEIFERYGFLSVETPIIEYEEFVKGFNERDEAVSDIFKLKDKGKRSLALRYEFTFQLKRLMQNKKLPFKRYQIGPVFRDEPISANRTRQFTQCDSDTVGSTIKDDAEILSLTNDVLKKLGIKFTIYFNNRKLMEEVLDSQKIKKKEEVIREIDKLDKLPEVKILGNLEKLGAKKVLKIFKNKEKLKDYKAYKEIKDLQKYLKVFKVDAEFSPTLARGLSYYNGTVFEVRTAKMKETICGGGAYKFNEKQCVGISFGLERLSSLAKLNLRKEQIILISLKEDEETIKLAQKLRKIGKRIIIFYGKPSKALEYANSQGIKKVIFVGQKEIAQKKFKVKDMKTGKEKLIAIEELL